MSDERRNVGWSRFLVNVFFIHVTSIPYQSVPSRCVLSCCHLLFFFCDLNLAMVSSSSRFDVLLPKPSLAPLPLPYRFIDCCTKTTLDEEKDAHSCVKLKDGGELGQLDVRVEHRAGMKTLTRT